MHLKPKLKRVGNKVAHPMLASQTNQNDNSKVLIKKRSDWFEK